ncbi:hypothetical protein LAG72_24810 [Escherichia coli]|uniref:Tail fiber assembly protein n=1 Tax=Rhizobium phage RHEph21 TaxID=2836134 RepID=A0AAE7VMX2_9CAUD|nr:hypothetical protein [Escherichia coli]MBZ5864349.1 hypothetical protein [Escherichia coli]QXV74668.1 putative tail fiber assembly protein [Rhizobium phage RHEph21]
MEIVNFGHFTLYSRGDGIAYFKNEEGQDWYDLRFGLTSWDEKGTFVDAIYGAWAMVDPETNRITNVEYDPSRLMPGDRIVLGIDADWATINVGWVYEDGLLKEPPPAPVVYPNLSPCQLWLAALEIELTKAQVLADVATIGDAKLRATLEIELTEPPLEGYVRDSFAVERLRELMAIPVDQFNTLWLWAATI